MVYCLMVTGYNDKRVEWAKVSVYNFLLQDYPNKQLLILNQNLQKSVIGINKIRNIQEILINNKPWTGKKSLGTLRNFMLDMVPENALYYTWDDDDWRHPSLLRSLVNVKLSNNVDFVFLKHRLNYNCNTNSLWRSTELRGQVIFLGKKSDKISFQYLDKDSLEDTLAHNLVNTQKTILWENHPQMYVRFVHSNNTSPFVNKDQTVPVLNAGPYTESVAFSEDYKYIESFIPNFEKVCELGV